MSFEQVILAARKGWAEGDAEIEKDEWIKGSLGYTEYELEGDCRGDVERRIWQLSELRIPAYYLCPRCHALV